MTDHVAPPGRTSTSARVAELHRQARDDFAKGQQQRAAARHATSYTALALAAATRPAHDPDDLDVAISVAVQVFNSDQLLSLREALRLLLRAHGVEPADHPPTDEPPALRCPAAHPEDPTPCEGPVVVTVLDATNAGADGCAHHGARLLASLEGGRVYALPDAPDGAAIAVFKAADALRPFPWLTDAPRTSPEQLSRAENRKRGDGQ
ncbi:MULTISPECIES: hypothetical protein [unclassified Streptomyces]|uniref:hypothetical protein n=1 Tax=unclassified Streptomyces TaxID=2593676 RepID=UPI0036E995A6